MLATRAVDARQESVDKWLNEYVGHFLREAGVKAGQIKISKFNSVCSESKRQHLYTKAVW